MKTRRLAAVMCISLLLTGCAARRSDGVPRGDFKSVSYSVSSMDRTANAGFTLRFEGEELLFYAGCFCKNVEFSIEGISLNTELADEITRIAAEHEMLARSGKLLFQPKVEALDDQEPYFAIAFDGEDETASLDDGYKKPDSFYDGVSEIRELLYSLAEAQFDDFFKLYGGTWTADNGAMGSFLDFSLTDDAALCRFGDWGAQRIRAAGDIASLELSSDGVYHLSVYYPADEPDDMGHARDGRWAEYYIRPLDDGGIAVSGAQEAAEAIYYFDADRQLSRPEESGGE